MRSIKFLVAAGALLLPVVALAQQSGAVGQTADTGCTQAAAEPLGEMYAIKVTQVATDLRNDILFDLRGKGGTAVGPGVVYDGGGGWSISPSWRAAQSDAHVQYTILTFPPTGPGQPGRISIDSTTVSSFDAGLVRMQSVGNSIPAGPSGLNSIELTLPGTASPYSVDLTPTVTKSFPAGSTSQGINIAFAPLIDVNDADPAGSFCTWGARTPDPLDTTDPAAGGGPLRGAIIGYNVYRIPGTAGTVPTPADFKAAITDGNPATGWVGFMDVRTLHQGTADGNPPSVGTPSPVEVSAGADIAGMQNPNGLPYDADEVMIFQDSSESTRTRPGGVALQPSTSQSYWYASQPVMVGRVRDFGPAIGWTNNDFTNGEHRCDMDGDTVADSVELDTRTCNPATIDFISPQANFGLDGLGLTHGSLPLLSAPMFFDSASNLPALGGVSVVTTVSGSDVSIQLTTGLEGRSIAGYNVYRQVGEQRVRVNEQPILAQGAESNVYSLLDTAVSSLRGPRVTSVQYMVETVYSDGTASSFAGPYSVELEAQQPTRRRR